MAESRPFQVLLGEGAVQDLNRLRDAAAAEATQYPDDKSAARTANRTLFKNVLRELQDLETGASKGHHVLGAHRGIGDGRDIVVSKIGDGTGKPNHRLTFREIPGRNAGGTDARDVIAIGARHGDDNVYQQTGARLGRTADRIAELDRFGEAQVGSGGKAHQRHPVLDANRAIAHAFDGQTPLSGTRPLSEAGFGSRTGSSGTTRQAGRQVGGRPDPQRGQ
ncbi:hypothetical protein [Kribbella italica]|uniref:Uncharacterized protein n=1 Tax=Kribbella italica TaxID=1540520 RepID=A0A7W9MVF3_9ACTN|nr:hypothetical protein [Kribbella italica]MBB5837764.1 hypothetical protein [Kribbella italica]